MPDKKQIRINVCLYIPMVSIRIIWVSVPLNVMLPDPEEQAYTVL